MKLSFLLPLAFAGGLGLFYWRGLGTTKPVSAAIQPAATRPAPELLLGVGTVLTSHSFPLAQHRHGPIKHLYVAGGQHVRKGELLLKYYDYTFLLAPTAGIVTELSALGPDQRSQGEPAFFFTAATPFRLRLPTGPASDKPAMGQHVQVQSTQHPAQVVTGVLLAVQPDSAALLLDLRLLTVGSEPLSVQAQVRVTRLPSLLKTQPR